VAAGAADTAAAALGTGLLEPGPVQLTIGTGGQIVAPLGVAQPDPTFRTHLYRAATPRQWYTMAAMQNVGLALEWVRGVLGVTWEEVYAEAFTIPPGADGLIFLPYLTGERTPHLDPRARGAWVGLNLHHHRAHLMRAALEGVAFSLRDGMGALESRGVHVSELRLAGGGAVESAWLQLLADVLGRPLLAVRESSASARGAALLAGIAAGAFADAADTLSLAPVPYPVASPSEQAGQYDEIHHRYGELYLSLQSTF
jgi:xylulokinase